VSARQTITANWPPRWEDRCQHCGTERVPVRMRVFWASGRSRLCVPCERLTRDGPTGPVAQLFCIPCERDHRGSLITDEEV
jgi:hypothetical protein